MYIRALVRKGEKVNIGACERIYTMKTTAVRLYGKNDMRLETFELPEISDNEILMRVISDSLCTSTYKAVAQGSDHKRVPNDINETPIIIGHEMCGEIVKVGSKVDPKWKVGSRAVVQPALNLDYAEWSVGYSYPYVGGNMTYAVIPEVVLERGCLIPYEGDFFKGSLAEPLSCVLRAFKGMYHVEKNFVRTDGAKRGGKIAILGGAGPMGLAAIDLAVNYAGMKQIVVTDLDGARLERAERTFPKSNAEKVGAELIYLNVSECEDQVKTLKEISGGGFDDVFVMVPVAALCTMGEQILAYGGCLNMFAGPSVHKLDGVINMYRVHYDNIHILGTAGGVPEDMEEILKLTESGKINPAIMISHILGINAVAETVADMGKATGAKKICYNGIDLPLTAIEDFGELGKTDPLYAALDEIVQRNGGLWCAEAEQYLLANAKRID